MPTSQESKDFGDDGKGKKRPWVRFRLWHILLLVIPCAWFAQNTTMFGNCRARIEVEKMMVTHDKQWDKYWAVLRGKFVSPDFKEGEQIRCFIEVDPDFSFGDRYKVGDQLSFRYQFEDYLGWKKEDPRQMVVRKFFGLEIEPVNGSTSFYVQVGRTESKPEK